MRDAREKAGLSQGELARQAGVHPTYISHVENGRRALGEEALARVSEVLGVSVAYLVEGEQAPDYRTAENALVEARRLSRMGEARAAADVLALVDVSALDVDAAARVGLAHAEALDLAGDLEVVDALESLCARLMEAHRYLQAAYAAMRIVMALTELADLHRAVARGEALLAQLPTSVAGSDEVVRLESTIIWAYIARGDTTYARYRGRQLLAHTRQHGSARAVSSVHWNLAFVDDALGDPDAALAQLESAIALAGSGEIDRDLPRLRLDRAFLLVSVEPPRAAEALVDLDAAQTALEVGESSRAGPRRLRPVARLAAARRRGDRATMLPGCRAAPGGRAPRLGVRARGARGRDARAARPVRRP